MILELGLVQIHHIGTTPPTDENAHRKLWIVLDNPLGATTDIRYFNGTQWVTIYGKSAFQVWKDLGNTGDETAFINAITGADGAPGPIGPAGADGADGATGPQGKSAYEVWIDAGNSGTEADFINAITGPQGPAGADGADGADGLGTVVAVVAGNAIDVDSTDPNNPIVSVPNNSIGSDELDNTAVVAGSYTNANIVVDENGRIQQAQNGQGGGVVQTVVAGDAIGVNNTNPSNPVVSVLDNGITTAKVANNAITSAKMSNTGVVAGAYTNVNITVDAAGRITAIANGSAGGSPLVYKETYTATIGDETNKNITITHNLGTTDVVLTSLQGAITYDYNSPDAKWQVIDANSISFRNSEIITGQTWRFIVQGF